MGKQCAGTIRLPAALCKQAVFWHGNAAASEWLETPIFFDLKKARTQTTFPAARRLASGQFLNRLVARLCQMRFRLGRRFGTRSSHTAFHHSSSKAAQKPRTVSIEPASA